eukprot:scaffold205535_cov35-Tisochrysis_lutea.AAC.3
MRGWSAHLTLAGETSTSLPRKQRIWSGGMGYPAAAPMVGGSLGASPQPAPSNSASASPDEKFSPVPSGSTSLTTGGDASAKAYSSRSCIASSSPPTSRWSRVLSAATGASSAAEPAATTASPWRNSSLASSGRRTPFGTSTSSSPFHLSASSSAEMSTLSLAIGVLAESPERMRTATEKCSSPSSAGST